jgi:hypothetical protein
VFDPATQDKARRNYRLLILDGHGSHVTRRFLDYCDAHRILVLVYPPHATHTLQPLDVSCFKPLSQSYSNELIYHNYTTQGDLPVGKADFISLFWPAWVNTFTEKLVSQAFVATGIHPLDPTYSATLLHWKRARANSGQTDCVDRYDTQDPQPPARRRPSKALRSRPYCSIHSRH